MNSRCSFLRFSVKEVGLLQLAYFHTRLKTIVLFIFMNCRVSRRVVQKNYALRVRVGLVTMEVKCHSHPLNQVLRVIQKESWLWYQGSQRCLLVLNIDIN